MSRETSTYRKIQALKPPINSKYIKYTVINTFSLTQFVDT